MINFVDILDQSLHKSENTVNSQEKKKITMF